jgi:hypothetical protein
MGCYIVVVYCCIVLLLHFIVVLFWLVGCLAFSRTHPYELLALIPRCKDPLEHSGLIGILLSELPTLASHLKQHRCGSGDPEDIPHLCRTTKLTNGQDWHISPAHALQLVSREVYSRGVFAAQ